MENNLNFSAIELYSRKALNPFLEKYFKGDKVTGQEILLLSPIEQVNLFIIQQLEIEMVSWSLMFIQEQT